MSESELLLNIFKEPETSRMMDLLRTGSDLNDKNYKLGGDVLETVVRVFRNQDDEQLVREILLQLNQYIDQGIYCLQKKSQT